MKDNKGDDMAIQKVKKQNSVILALALVVLVTFVAWAFIFIWIALSPYAN